MARRRKNRTHLKGGVASAGASGKIQDGTPKSFVIKHGQVGPSLAQLVRDVRKLMEPNTASRLRERSRNKLRDYITLAPTLGVTHLLAFTLTDKAPSLRIVRLPAGPMLSFRIERYSLVKDVLHASKHARSIGMEYLSPPLLVLASFPASSPTMPPHLPLLQKAFQTLFPPLAPQKLHLSSARRVVLVAYNPDRGTVDVRHYRISVKAAGVSKRVRRVLEGAEHKGSGFVDLGSEKDVADFLLRRRGEAGPGGDGYESAASSASSAAGDEEATSVALADDYVGRNNRRGTKRAVRLDEIGPRLELRLVKISEGVPGKEGAVIYHNFVKKTKKEKEELKAAHVAKEKLRKQRREEQERNVQRKKAQEEGQDVNDEMDEEQDEEDEAEDGENSEEDAGWDEDEDISEGEDNEAEEAEGSESEEEQVYERRPTKKVKFKGNS